MYIRCHTITDVKIGCEQVVYVQQLVCCIFSKYSLNSNLFIKLEGHSVERMYLRQKLSDSSVNKIILKPLLAPKTTPSIRVRGIFLT